MIHYGTVAKVATRLRFFPWAAGLIPAGAHSPFLAFYVALTHIH